MLNTIRGNTIISAIFWQDRFKSILNIGGSISFGLWELYGIKSCEGGARERPKGLPME
jgi:hypothetical protein